MANYFDAVLKNNIQMDFFSLIQRESLGFQCCFSLVLLKTAALMHSSAKDHVYFKLSSTIQNIFLSKKTFTISVSVSSPLVCWRPGGDVGSSEEKPEVTPPSHMS